MYIYIYIIMTLSQPEGQSKSACCWIGRTARPLNEWRHVTSIFTTSMRHVIQLVTLTSHPWPEKPNTMHPWNHPIIQWSWNPWHPWHPRMPLIQLFRGTTWLLLFGPCLGVGVRRILKIKAMSDRYWIGGMRKAKLQLSPNKGEV